MLPYLSILAIKFNCTLLLTTEVDSVMLWIRAIKHSLSRCFDVTIQLYSFLNMVFIITFSLNSYYAFHQFLHVIPYDIRMFMLLKSSSTQMHDQTHMCTSLKEDIMTCYYQVTFLSYSTIAWTTQE